MIKARLAQLVRASVLLAEGLRFEPAIEQNQPFPLLKKVEQNQPFPLLKKVEQNQPFSKVDFLKVGKR